MLQIIVRATVGSEWTHSNGMHTHRVQQESNKSTPMDVPAALFNTQKI